MMDDDVVDGWKDVGSESGGGVERRKPYSFSLAKKKKKRDVAK